LAQSADADTDTHIQIQALPHVLKIQAAQPGGHFSMHGNYVSRNFICVNVMQQKAEAGAGDASQGTTQEKFQRKSFLQLCTLVATL